MALFSNCNKGVLVLSKILNKRIYLRNLATDVYSNNFHYNEKDPAPLFFNKEIQQCLKVLTRIDLHKVYKKRKEEGKRLETPEYKFMTTKQLDEFMDKVKQAVDEKLQMPPVIKVRKPISEILSTDSALKGYDKAKYVFTDITYGIPDRQRLIVTRESDGTLKKSNWDVRHRMNQLYFPKKGTSMVTPRMFENKYLESLLERKEYEFILDAACCQFEPDEELYQTVTSTTYNFVNKENDFDILRSSRHFGPFVFFLAWTKNIDNILLELLQTKHMQEIQNLLQLYYKICEENVDNIELHDLLRKYVDKSPKKNVLELATQALMNSENSLSSRQIL